ncbi:TPA: TcpQ domain-containing protein [Citrobacter freundii]|nr:TcpQ domain-containing protein [Citrobacter freundii]
MKTSKLIILAASAISVAGCSSNKLPLPKGDKQALNQNGIPAELAIAIAREKSRALSTATSNSQLNTTYSKAAIQPVETNKFSHAKNNASTGYSVTVSKDNKRESKNSSVPVTTYKSTAPRNPFSGSRNDPKVNAIVSSTYSNPIKNVAPLKTGAVDGKHQAVSKTGSIAVDKKITQPAVSLKPIALEVTNSKVWIANAGSSLNKTLNKWVQDEKCSVTQRWNIVWPENIDYPIDVQLSFNGSFYDVITKMFSLYSKAEKPLYLDVYPQPSCVLYVSTTANGKKDR